MPLPSLSFCYHILLLLIYAPSPKKNCYRQHSRPEPLTAFAHHHITRQEVIIIEGRRDGRWAVLDNLLTYLGRVSFFPTHDP